MSDLTSLQYIGDAECLIEYEYQRAERGMRDRYGLQMEPDYPASVTVLAVQVNGAWVDAENFSTKALGMLADKILEEVETDQADLREYYQEMRADAAREERGLA